jgi:hypothetical protein
MPIGGVYDPGGPFPLTSAVRQPILDAINERMRAIGAIEVSGDFPGKRAVRGTYVLPSRPTGGALQFAPEVVSTIFTGNVTGISGDGRPIVTASGTSGTTEIGDPSWHPHVGDTVNVQTRLISGIGLVNYAFPSDFKWQFNSYKELQSLLYNLAAFRFTNDVSDRSGLDAINDFPNSFAMHNISLTNQQFDYASWPPPNGFTRYREPEISRLDFSVTYAEGDRARFVYNTGGTIEVESFYAGFPMPNSSLGEKQYSGKIMKRQGGVWVVDPDQSTPIMLRTFSGQPWKGGDVLVKPCTDQLLDAAKSLVAIWRQSDQWDTYYRPGAASFGTGNDITAAGAEGLAEANWSSFPETNVFTGSVSLLAQNPFTMYYLQDRFGTGDNWIAGVTSAKTRLNSANFQNPQGPGGLSHAFSSAIDIYYSTENFRDDGGIHAPYVFQYDPPIAGMASRKWFKTETLVPTTADVRTGTYIGQNATHPARPATIGGGSISFRGYGFYARAVLQRFNVLGGFVHV